jgi:hypothetical protein
MQKVKGDFSYNTNKAPMGALTDSLMDSAMVYAAGKLQADPAEKEKAIATLSEVVQSSIMNNMGTIVFIGLLGIVGIVGLTSITTTYVLRKQ